MSMAARRKAEEEVARSLADSPWERGLRAAKAGESGERPKLVMCACCKSRPAEPGSAFCGEFCAIDAEIREAFRDR
jgi:hypothetical protein